MLKSIEIGYVKSFNATQKMELAQPSGDPGSGFNLVVGRNNAGKSTIIKLLRDALSNQPTIVVGAEQRRAIERPEFRLTWRHKGNDKSLFLDRSGSGGHISKRGDSTGDVINHIKYVPARRAFAAAFHAHNGITPVLYEQQAYESKKHNADQVDPFLSVSLAQLLIDEARRPKMLATLKKISEDFAELHADHFAGKDVIQFTSASGKPHILSDCGDGLVNLMRIAHAIETSEDGDCLIIDEPELSLHPQLQRALFELLVSEAANLQLIVVSHSPHFVSWKYLAKSGAMFRLFLDSDGWSRIAKADRTLLATIAMTADGNITNRKYFDTLCKELFFSNEAVLVEGSDDVHYLSNFLDASGAPPLPLMGYGCGGAGNISQWMRLCSSLGIRAIAIYDGDKKDDFEKAKLDFASDPNMACYLLPAEDIRDKHERDNRNKETIKVLKSGIFKRDGTVHDEYRVALEKLIVDVRRFIDKR